MRTLFVDTNVFEQCCDLNQLPWSEVAGGEDILLLVCRPVQEEIDKHKHDGNSRRAGRARHATTFLRQLIRAEPAKVVLRAAGPHVEAARLAPAKFDAPPFPFLDLSRNDDRIIAEALQYKKDHPEELVALLTHDTTPLGTAKDCGLAIETVPDTWLLPSEPDEKDKKIAKLEELIRRSPKITISLAGYRPKIEIEVDRHQPLSPEHLDELVAIAQETSPLVTDFGCGSPKQMNSHEMGALAAFLSPRREFVPASNDEIQKYREAYENWRKEVRGFLSHLHAWFELPTRRLALSVEIDNVGTVPAEHLMAEFELHGGPLFKPTGEKAPTELSVPIPPVPPKGRWVEHSVDTIMANLSRHDFGMDFPRMPTNRIDFASLVRPILRDKHQVYWNMENLPSASLSCECEEFRHKVGPTSFPLMLFIPQGCAGGGALLSCRVTAKNLPEPTKFQVPITVHFREMDTFSIARTMFEPRARGKLRISLLDTDEKA